MKALLIILSLLLVLLIAGLWVGPGSYPDRWRTEDRTAVLESDNAEKKKEIKKIRDELNDVASGKAAIEERARSELGMTKKGETFYEVILQKKKPISNKKANNKQEKNTHQTPEQKAQGE